MDWLINVSPKKSATGKINKSLTARHFGITRQTVDKWYKRYKPYNLHTLESKSRRPKHVREVIYDIKLVNAIKSIRKENPTYSKWKVRYILIRDNDKLYHLDYIPSFSTIGRIITKYNMFYRVDLRQHKKLSKSAKRTHKNRKPKDLHATAPRQIIEFDMKHVLLIGSCKQYAMVAIDTVTKETFIHVTSQPSSNQAKVALEKVFTSIDKDGVIIVNDNGSENMKHTQEFLESIGVTQYFARPRKPKDKPHVERIIGTLQRECLDYIDYPATVPELQIIINKFLYTYHTYRPHMGLGMLTPEEFCNRLNITPIFRSKV
jgi:transposase InsO family protein